MESLKRAEDECPLSKFINILDNDIGIGQVNIKNELASIESNQKQNVEQFFSKLKKNYSSITTYCADIKENCCSYLNYWIDKQRVNKVISVNNVAWIVIDKLWNTLKNSSISCDRKHYNKPFVDMEKCAEFMVYCVNRNELRKHCEQDDELKNEYCRNFNEYTKNYYNQFSKKVTCLRDTNKDIHYNWQFSDTCTLHNVARTFPKYDTNSETIVDDTSRKPINKCEDSGESKTINCYMLDGVPVTLEELPTIDMILLKHGIYAGTSILGFFSLGLYLYKKTRHPSLIRFNSSREKKINKNTDKQFSHEQEKKSNSKNKDYKFSYNPTQN
ncbi:VIR protein [Plasmodium vivax]|uniref:VIR protein n=1 Tax=Plasmodium vivax TaxID=5855 RepID=A0A1G4E9E7_PLAVI|nr:VIR protein [Plasmodium vivax]SCA82006.1 VIR protein [Plasmodium vivax]